MNALFELCIRRPVLASVLSIVVLLVGAISYTRLSVREYPRIDEPVVSVQTTYKGASAEVVESQVSKILEDSLSGIEGVEVMTSQSRSERSNINVRFRLTRDPDSAAADVRDKVARVRGKLPEAVDEPVIAKVEADSFPILFIGVQAGRLTALQASDYLNRYVKPRLSVLPGAADVRLFGERQISMRIDLDRDKLAAYRLTVQDVEDALRRQNVEIPSGRIESTSREFSVVAQTDLATRAGFEGVIIANVAGYPVRIADLGQVAVGALDERVIARFNGETAINIGVIKQAVANPLELSKTVRAEIAKINENLPGGMQLVMSYDSSVFIERSIGSVFHTIGEAIALVVLVIFVFLRNLRATLVPLVTIPVSLIGAFGLMYVFGFTINTLTLLAMVLAIGLVVDDAIVVLENIFRNLEDGMERKQAAIVGIREIGFAVIAMTLTLAAVYAPLAFATGRTGRLFIEFALTLAGAVLVSGFVALTLSPMMCSLLLRHETSHGWLYNRIERGFDAMTGGYDRLLMRLLDRRWIVVVVADRDGRRGRVPVQGDEVRARADRGSRRDLRHRHRAAGREPDLHVGARARHREDVRGDPGSRRVELVLRRPDRDRRARRAAPEAVGGAHAEAAGHHPRASAEVRRAARHQRVRAESAVARPVAALDAARVRRDVAGAVPGPAGDGRPLRRRPVEVPWRRQHPDRPQAQHARAPCRRQPRQDERPRRPGGDGRPDAGEHARRPAGDALQARRRAVRRDRAGRAARPHAAERHQRPLRAHARSQQMVPLANILDVKEGVSPQSLNHFNRQRAVTVTATLAPGFALGDALAAAKASAARTLPATAQTDLNGVSREFRDSAGSIYVTFVLALAFIYLVLAAQFESFVDPFVIMLSVPLSITGALLALWLSGGTLNIYSQIGLITLVGLITKHGILIVEFANQLRAKGMAAKQAVREAAVLRLRPILMTTGAMVLGAVPLALATGAGAESRRQIGWVIVGGMTLGTLLTLFVVPTVYTLVARGRRIGDPRVALPLDGAEPALVGPTVGASPLGLHPGTGR